MRVACQALAIFAAASLAACGSHSNPAPVVYGAGDAHQSRIYNSPDEIYRKQQIEQNRTTRTARAPVRTQTMRVSSAQGNGAAITPVSAVYLSDAVSAPVETKKVKGYIEVQPGDTVYGIARRFNVAPQDIISKNDLRAPYALRVGQALKLPKGAEALATPVEARKVVARDRLYSVKRGDTLYSISKASKVSVSAIAQANALRQPYSLSIGQQLLVPQAPTNSQIYAKPRTSPSKIANATATTAPRNVGDIARTASYTPPVSTKGNSLFDWPVKGAIISSYGAGDLGRRNDGVNIAAPAGTPVRAAAGGEVVYRGSELDGFGNLLLVKHVDGFVTAYAHNDAMLVKKGDQVRQGQVIAKVGDSGAVTSPQLHFEIRKNLKSIDPTSMLGAQ